MTDFSGYKPFQPLYRGRLEDLSAREAKQSFDHLMQAKADRIDELRNLLARNGLGLRDSDDGIVALGKWLASNVELGADGDVRGVWYSVVNDIALFVEDVIQRRTEGRIRWTYYKSRNKADVAFQRHVLMGFSKVKNPRYNVDLDYRIADIARRAAAGAREEEGKTLAATVKWILEKA